MKTPTPYFGPFRGPADRRRINLASDEERAWWCRRLGVGESELVAAVDAVGSAAGLVAEHLGRDRPKSAAARFALSRRSLYSIVGIALAGALCASCASGGDDYYRNSTAYWGCDDGMYGSSAFGCDRPGWDDWDWNRRHRHFDDDDMDRGGHVGGGDGGGGGMGDSGMGGGGNSHREFQRGNQPPPFAGKDS